jgi:hypothetical protein
MRAIGTLVLAIAPSAAGEAGAQMRVSYGPAFDIVGPEQHPLSAGPRPGGPPGCGRVSQSFRIRLQRRP